MVLHWIRAIDRADCLSDLAYAESLEGPCLDADGLRAKISQDVRCPGEQEVAGEDGNGVVPPSIG